MLKGNLPLEYNQLSKFFELLGSSSEDWRNQVIEKILKKYPVHTVLDLTCGTGSQVFWLAKQGFQIIGSDLSAALIKIAKQKARDERVKVQFFQGDMRSQQLGHFDAVITIFNAVGHLTKAGFEKAMRNIYQNLNPNGLYVFDIINSQSLTSKILANMRVNVTGRLDQQHISYLEYIHFDKKQSRLNSYDYVFLQKATKKPQLIQNKFFWQIYTLKELREMLTKNGFRVLEQYGVDGSKFSAKTSREMLIVAQKI